MLKCSGYKTPSLFANLSVRPVRGGEGPPPTNTYQPSAEICEGMNVVLYSNNLYKYILPGWLSVHCPVSGH